MSTRKSSFPEKHIKLVLHVFRNYAHQFVSPKGMKEEGKEKLGFTFLYEPYLLKQYILPSTNVVWLEKEELDHLPRIST